MDTNSYVTKIIIFSVLLTYISACTSIPANQTNGSPDSSTSAGKTTATLETRLTEQSKQFDKTNTIAGGAVAGALLFGLAAAIISGKAEHVTAAAAAGAAAGGAAGYYIAKKQEQYANESARIDSMVSDVNKDNEALCTYLVTVRQYIDESKTQIAQINEKYAAEQISKGTAKAQINKITENRQQIAKAVDNLKQRKAEFMHAAEEQQKSSGEESVALLNKQIKDLEQNIQDIESELKSLDSALQLSLV